MVLEDSLDQIVEEWRYKIDLLLYKTIVMSSIYFRREPFTHRIGKLLACNKKVE